MARTSISIELDLDGPADSPAGTAALANGTVRTFHGWLGLTEAIVALVAISAESDPSRRTHPRRPTKDRGPAPA
jgi:hypothetical protein